MVSRLRLGAQVFLAIVFHFALVIEHPVIALPAQFETLNLSYSALVPSGAPFWIAQDLKLFEREGLKTELLYINAAPRVMAAMLAGEIQIALSGVSPLVTTYAQGQRSRGDRRRGQYVAIFARPEIRKPPRIFEENVSASLALAD